MLFLSSIYGIDVTLCVSCHGEVREGTRKEAVSMKRLVGKALLATFATLVIAGCATAPEINKGSPNFIQKGTVSAKLKDNDFYMAIGEVDLYRYGLFGDLAPSGQTVEIAVVIQADKDTGEALRIATMQANTSGAAADSQNGVTLADGANYVLADLRGGISVIDIQPYPHWLDAIQAMRKAITDLSTYTTFTGSDQHGFVVVAIAPQWHWRGGGGFWHRRYR